MDVDADAGWRRQGILYPTMLIAAISVIIFSMVGIAAMMGLLPSAVSGYRTDRDVARPEVQREARDAGQAPDAASKKSRPAAVACADCGIVESIRSLQHQGEGTAVGALTGTVVGGVLGNQIGEGSGRTAATIAGAGAGAFGGNEIERNRTARVTYQVRVKMSDGSHRNVYQATEPRVAVGQRVRVFDGQLRVE